HEARKHAAVVEMRVRQHHGVERGRPEGQRLPVALAQGLAALEHAAVDQHLATGCRPEQMLGTGHRLCGAEEGEVGQTRAPGGYRADRRGEVEVVFYTAGFMPVPAARTCSVRRDDLWR